MNTIIIRHRRENLKKCSLRGLENRADTIFLSYPHTSLPDLKNVILLTIEAEELSINDRDHDLLLLDATWRWAGVMEKNLSLHNHPLRRSLPAHFKTAYPRRQTDCPQPGQGLASIEALYVAYTLLQRDPSGLLDNYHWKMEFLAKNNTHL